MTERGRDEEVRQIDTCGEFLSLLYLVYVKGRAGEIFRLTPATLIKVENGPIFQFLYLKDVIFIIVFNLPNLTLLA